ncbi:MAG: RNA polymerase sigma factor [Longimicrobiales bacterium]
MTRLDAGRDASIIAAVLGGNVDAFAQLVARYRDAYTRYAVRVLGSKDDADDALQSAFVRAYRKLDRCRDPQRFGAWLYQIVINECRTLSARRDRREQRLVRAEDQVDATTEIADATVRHEVQRALDQLDARQREAFVLKHVEELSYDEMVELTGVGESALKMRVQRACERLRHLLEGVYL